MGGCGCFGRSGGMENRGQGGVRGGMGQCGCLGKRGGRGRGGMKGGMGVVDGVIKVMGGEWRGDGGLVKVEGRVVEVQFFR